MAVATRYQAEQLLGRKLHSGGPKSIEEVPIRRTPSRTAYRSPVRRRSGVASGAFLGAVGGSVMGAGKKRASAHHGITLFMVGIGVIIVLTAKMANGETAIVNMKNWITKVTKGGAIAAAPSGASSGPQQAPTGTLLGPTKDEVAACGSDPGTSDMVGHFKWVACAAKFALTH